MKQISLFIPLLGTYYFPAVPEPVRNLSVTPPHPIPV